MADTEAVRPLGPVRLAVPATGQHLRVVRLTAAAVAVGLDVEQLDDFWTAISELCGLLIGQAPAGSQLDLLLHSRSDGHRHQVAVDATLAGAAPGLSIDPASRLVLDGLDVEWTSAAPHLSFHLTAPARSTAGPTRGGVSGDRTGRRD